MAEASKIAGAWEDCQGHLKKRKAALASNDLEDLETPLQRADREQFQDHFWKRHEFNFPVEITPADRLIVRLHKELHTRQMHVYDLKKAYTVAECQGLKPKRQKLTDEVSIDLKGHT